MPETPFTVLLVEDDARDAGRLARAFTSAGLAGMMQTVASVEEAVSYLSGRGSFGDRKAYPLPGLILLNLGLSRRANFKLLRWLRGEPTLHRVPVVVLAAAREPVGYDQAWELGAAAYLVKPVASEELASMVEAVVAFWSMDQRSQDRPNK